MTISVQQQLAVWSKLGVSSFGGGVATLSMIQRAVVNEHQWLTSEEFARYWGLVQLAPGINLVGLTVLIGQRVGGTIGVVIALCGLLLPSAAITVLITALYAHFQHQKLVAEAVAGIIPATVGMGVVTGLQIAVPVLQLRFKRSALSLMIGLSIFILSAIFFLIWKVPVVAVLITAGTVGALTQVGLVRIKRTT